MIRQGIAAVLVMALANGLYGYPPPVDLSSLGGAVMSVTVFVGYLYLVRSLVRLPLAITGFRSRYRHARETYGLERNGALADGFLRGFMDRRRWDNPTLATLERALFMLAVWWACQPDNVAMARGIGVLGVLLLVFLYMGAGSYRGLVDDGIAPPGRRLPGNIPNLRRPPDDF